MKTARRVSRSPGHAAGDADPPGVVSRLTGAAGIALRSTGLLLSRAAGAMRATRAGAADTASALQVLPDSTLRGLAATSIGLGAGFYLARKPRLAVVAGIAPALLAGMAIVLRPAEPAVQAETVGARTRGTAARHHEVKERA